MIANTIFTASLSLRTAEAFPKHKDLLANGRSLTNRGNLGLIRNNGFIDHDSIDHPISGSHQVSLQLEHLKVRFYFSSRPSLCSPMPASPDPRNMFEVTVPHLFGQDQSFSFTFRPACPGPVVSLFIGCNTTTYSYISDSKTLCGLAPVHPTELTMHLRSYMRPICQCSGSNAIDPLTRLGRCFTSSHSTHVTTDPCVEGLLAHSNF